MKCSRTGTLSRTSGFDGQHRFTGLPGNLSCGLKKLTTISNILEVHKNYIRIRIIFEITQQICLIHIGFVTKADEFGEPNVSAFCIIEHRGTKGSGL